MEEYTALHTKRIARKRVIEDEQKEISTSLNCFKMFNMRHMHVILYSTWLPQMQMHGWIYILDKWLSKMSIPNSSAAFYSWAGSVETSKPGGMKTTSSHIEVELSCKNFILYYFRFAISNIPHFMNRKWNKIN